MSSACQCTFCARRSAKCSMPAPDGGVGELVDQDEAAERAVLARRARRRSACRSRSLATPMALSSSVLAARCSSVLTLTWYLGGVTVAGDGLRAELQPVGAARQHRLLGHPHDRGLELIGHLRRVDPPPRCTSPRLTIDLVGQASASPIGRPRRAARSPCDVTMRATRGSLPEGSTRTRVARPHAAAGNHARRSRENPGSGG